MLVMNQILQVSQKNLDTQEMVILCEEAVEIDESNNKLSFTYHEVQPYSGTVTCTFTENSVMIQRVAEGMNSQLRFDIHRPTKGIVSSMYGDIEMELVTTKYIRSDKGIFLEYYTCQNKEKLDSFRFVFKFRNLA